MPGPMQTGESADPLETLEDSRAIDSCQMQSVYDCERFLSSRGKMTNGVLEVSVTDNLGKDAGVVRHIRPLEDPRWDELVHRHPHSSVFHSRPWLQALNLTYGYRPLALTTSSAESVLSAAVVFCEVDSWITGRRLVSLPFSDHCAPLLERGDDSGFMSAIETECREKRWKYVELRLVRPFQMDPSLSCATTPYALHTIDLDTDLDTLFGNLHKGSVQRKIRKAEREALVYEEGSTESLLKTFYDLVVLTRRRQRLPPQPYKWFLNLLCCFGDHLTVCVVSARNRPVAGMLTLQHKLTLTYKYGAMDYEFRHLGPMQYLFWRRIMTAKNSGLQTFDLGRSHPMQGGLITFKRRFGADESRLFYSRYSPSGEVKHVFDVLGTRRMQVLGPLMSKLSPRVLRGVGSLFYRHIG